jgi:hypothetical protein
MTNGQIASLSWCQATIRAHDQFFFHFELFFRQLQVCYFVAPSLTRGWVCNLLLLQGLASAVPLVLDHILLSQFFRILQPGGPGPRIYIPAGTGWPSYTPRHWVYFPQVKVTLQPTVSRPVILGVRPPSGTHDQFFFLLEIFFRKLHVCYFVAPSLTRGRVCNLLLLLVLATAVPLGSALSNERSGLSFVREVLHNIVIEFGVPMKLVRLIKIV